MSKFSFLLLSLIFFLNACATKENDKDVSFIKESKQDLEMVAAYKEGYEALDNGDPYFAANKFLEAELLYPQSEWASKSALMASYSYYMQNFYPEAISNLERYLKTYPMDKNVAYAHYLIAMCYYETIEDEKRDTAPLINAKEKFDFVVTNYPSSDFALDAKFKLGLIKDVLASKEMYLGRHYLKKQKWIAAINRFKTVVEKYDQTIFIEEALHRLVEINYKLGLKDESQKYATTLGYNYLSSDWYKKSYKVFNQDYSNRTNNKIKKDKKGVIERFKKLFD
jgi:outer membrane protein assembly factor BamD